MVLYHFCAAHMVEKILQEGLRLGVCPISKGGQLDFINNCQWLTQEPDPKKQSWATQSLVPYSRTAVRLTINIPDNYRNKLWHAQTYIYCAFSENRHLVDNWEGSEKWYIYRGKIPPKWIVGYKKMRQF